MIKILAILFALGCSTCGFSHSSREVADKSTAISTAIAATLTADFFALMQRQVPVDLWLIAQNKKEAITAYIQKKYRADIALRIHTTLKNDEIVELAEKIDEFIPLALKFHEAAEKTAALYSALPQFFDSVKSAPQNLAEMSEVEKYFLLCQNLKIEEILPIERWQNVLDTTHTSLSREEFFARIEAKFCNQLLQIWRECFSPREAKDFYTLFQESDLFLSFFDKIFIEASLPNALGEKLYYKFFVGNSERIGHFFSKFSGKTEAYVELEEE